MILGEFMKKVKRKVNRKRIAIVVLIPVICIALLIANFTSIRLSIKGYHKEDKKVVLKLEKDDIKDIYEIRARLEGLCAKRAAKNVTAAQIAELEENIYLVDFHYLFSILYSVPNDIFMFMFAFRIDC